MVGALDLTANQSIKILRWVGCMSLILVRNVVGKSFLGRQLVMVSRSHLW